ncbi:MAG TPA: type II toxin-antitoxin system PemK/MazF family toxin [Pyrinomonadaceae bacterium]|nr:type II toxin-antitoxin system PemK/MazF family toxin [Pyrinomonadaceae bacterium]
MEMVKRFEVYLVNLDEEPSDDPRNSRPGVVISPDEANGHLDHVLIAPLSATNAPYPTRVAAEFLNSERYIILDQIRAVDKNRLSKKIGEIDASGRSAALAVLAELFAA